MKNISARILGWRFLQILNIVIGLLFVFGAMSFTYSPPDYGTVVPSTIDAVLPAIIAVLIPTVIFLIAPYTVWTFNARINQDIYSLRILRQSRENKAADLSGGPPQILLLRSFVSDRSRLLPLSLRFPMESLLRRGRFLPRRNC